MKLFIIVFPDLNVVLENNDIWNNYSEIKTDYYPINISDITNNIKYRFLHNFYSWRFKLDIKSICLKRYKIFYIYFIYNMSVISKKKF